MHVTTIDTFDDFGGALARARSEFLEMPGLTLTVEQAKRLWGYDAAFCRAVLEALEQARFLVRLRGAVFVRAVSGR